MKKTHVYLDLNLMFYRFVYKCSGKRKNKSSVYLINDDDKDEYISGITSGIVHYLKNPVISSCNSFTMVGDDGSWRRDIKEANYKENRENKKKPFDQDIFDELNDNFIKNMIINKNLGYIAAPKIEADDFLYFLSAKNKSSDHNTIIISNDSDLKQLVYNNGNSWCILMNSKGGFIADKKIEDKRNEDDFFIFDPDQVNQNSMIDHINNRIEIINPKKELLVKILSGDTTDNIPSCYYRGKRNISYTKDRATKMINEHFSEIDLSNIDDLAMKVIKSCDVKDVDIENDFPKVVSGISLNKKLIMLHVDNYPDHIRNVAMERVSSWKPKNIPPISLFKDNNDGNIKYDVF